ncbi:hypothetical protein QL285_064608 [Trifolium repens]|nr:hypothetical protein QL285_064608 [Trifolium repens]
MRETRTFNAQSNPTTILIHREPYRTLSHKNATSIELISYSTSILIATFDEDDEFVLNETFDSNSHSICNPKRFLIFHTSFLLLQRHTTLLFKERIELSKFGQNSTYVYRYK